MTQGCQDKIGFGPTPAAGGFDGWLEIFVCKVVCLCTGTGISQTSRHRPSLEEPQQQFQQSVTEASKAGIGETLAEE